MNELVEVIASERSIDARIVGNIVGLIENGATIPFMARYRKEMTGSMDEVGLLSIYERYEQLKELQKRKEYVITTIAEKNMLTSELKSRIINSWNATEIEDLYLPFKSKRRTRAEIARRNGLEPLAKFIMAQKGRLPSLSRFYNSEIKSDNDVLAGAKDIIAEWISEDIKARNRVRRIYGRSAVIKSKIIKGKESEGLKYRDYFDFNEPLNKCSSHRYLAVCRGKNEGYLRLSLTTDIDIEQTLIEMFIKGVGELQNIVVDAIKDGYNRLMRPSIETELFSEAKIKADVAAVEIFSKNLRTLLLSPPLGEKRVLALDPGYRTGCKLVCLDSDGTLIYNDTIYPHPPKNDFFNSSRKIQTLIEQYKIDAIAVGNGTAGRETEEFIKKIRFNRDVAVFMVNEDGASVYSASNIAREEFPDYDVTVRGAVSIGRRLMDPLSELVKIEPKSIGVGQYQHDVDQSLLKRKLDMTVESCVNSVGVNLNTAGKELLTYVSGLGSQLAKNIVDYRKENGLFPNRKSLLNVPRLGIKAYEQCAAFLRISDSDNPLDNTSIHPERYSLVEQMASDLGLSLKQFISSPDAHKKINKNKYFSKDVGIETLTDILDELDKPNRDPRGTANVFEFDKRISSIEDVKIGMKLPGIVTNITAFGCFVDLGIKTKGLIHVSELSDSYIKSPDDVVSVNTQLFARVIDVDLSRQRISLSLKEL